MLRGRLPNRCLDVRQGKVSFPTAAAKCVTATRAIIDERRIRALFAAVAARLVRAAVPRWRAGGVRVGRGLSCASTRAALRARPVSGNAEKMDGRNNET